MLSIRSRSPLDVLLHSRVEGVELGLRDVVISVTDRKKNNFSPGAYSKRKKTTEGNALLEDARTHIPDRHPFIVLIVHHGECRVMTMSCLTRGRVAGSSFPGITGSPFAPLLNAVVKPVRTTRVSTHTHERVPNDNTCH